MGKILAIFTLLVGMAVALWSCSSTGCIENKSSIPLAGFYDSKSKKTVRISGVNINGVGSETFLLSSGESSAQVYLPLRSQQRSTSFCFNYATDTITGAQLNDTITFEYDAEPHFVSEECGAMYYYKINALRYTQIMIDSVKLEENIITNTDIERVKIYFRVEESVE